MTHDDIPSTVEFPAIPPAESQAEPLAASAFTAAGPTDPTDSPHLADATEPADTSDPTDPAALTVSRPARSARPPAETSPRAAQTALFRAHATARLRGDTAGALALAMDIGEAQRLAHMVFLISLFTQVVYEEYGDRPDPSDLAALTKHLHEKHRTASPGFMAIRAEALVRAVCGESHWFNEIPLSEQPGYLWAVMTELVDPESTDAALTERFDLADELRTDIFREVGATAEAEAPQGSRIGPDNAHSPAPGTDRAIGDRSTPGPAPRSAKPFRDITETGDAADEQEV
ncbi:hypothetical protein GCM10009830_05090 [Glycomyces endophyticus]|uniref:Uncharacterized protein n=1 Tax=Glycomyces endophyticus TaxID=480996 RepID=A0ABP4S0V4_9ACTN